MTRSEVHHIAIRFQSNCSRAKVDFSLVNDGISGTIVRGEQAKNVQPGALRNPDRCSSIGM